jgi:hypothetical protein
MGQSKREAANRAVKNRANALVAALQRIKQDLANPRVSVVYQLVDPRDGKPFYIGAGTEGRPFKHLPAALEGERGAKADRIREIVAAGLMPEVQILAVTNGRNTAFDIEATLIKSTPGLLNTVGNRKQPEINLRDEFCAAVIMLEPHRKERMERIASTFTDKDAEPYAGHLTLLNAARKQANGR